MHISFFVVFVVEFDELFVRDLHFHFLFGGSVSVSKDGNDGSEDKKLSFT